MPASRLIRLLSVMTALAAPAVARAQVSLELGPTLGRYRPLGDFDPASVSVTSLPRTPQDLNSWSWGGEARLWLGRRVGAELRASVAQSTVPSVPAPGGPRPETPARIGTFLAQGVFALPGTPNRYRVWVSAGAGLVRHGGEAYEAHGSPADAGPVIGAGAAVRLFRGLRATLGASALFYTLDVPMPPRLSGNPGSLQRGKQSDLHIQFGLTWLLGAAR